MTPTPRSCRECSRPVEATARFCRHCGIALAPEPSSPTTMARHGGAGGEGERKRVTVLFADVQGSVALAERIEAEDWHGLMAGFFRILAESVRRYEGTVSRFTGDGIMAIFGAPVAQEEHALRACHAAIDARDALPAYAAEVRCRDDLSFSARIGLHSGEVVAAHLADAEGTYTAIGRTVGLAERMEQLAEPGTIYLTEATAALVGGSFHLRDLGSFDVRGAPGPLRVYSLIGRAAHRTRLDRARERGFSRFVGRRRELEVLERALARAVAGTGQVVEIVGEPGTGKSRLCHELAAACARRGIRVVEWRCFAHLSATPFLTFIEEFRHLARVAPGDPDASVRDKIERLLGGIDGSLHEFAPLLWDFLGVAEPARASTRDPGSVMHELLRMTEQLTLAASRGVPTVVILEDLHWVDRGSAALLETFLATVASTRLLTIVTSRPHLVSPASARGERIALGPLSRPDAAELVDALLGPHPSLVELAPRILERAEGNPFFIEEIVQSLVEAGILEGDTGALRLARPAEHAALPATLATTLAARIDRLPPRDKRVLQTAAVIGLEFSDRLLRLVAEDDGAAVEAALPSLVRAGFLQTVPGSSDVRYRFSHPLVQEEAYGSRLAEGLRRTHAAVARALVAVEAGKLDERAALLAVHHERAGDRLGAARWTRRAAAWTSPRDVTAALGLWRRLRDLLRGLADREAVSLAVEARIRILELGARVGIGDDEGRRSFEEARELASGIGDARALAEAFAGFAQLRGFSGDAQAAVELSERAVELALETGDEALIHGLRVALVFAYFTAGRFRETCALAERALDPWPTRPVPAHARLAHPTDCYLVLFHAMAIVDMGRIDEARRELEIVIDAAQRDGVTEVLCMAYGFSPVVAQISGEDPAPALARARRAVALAERLGSPFSVFFARWGLGLAQLLCSEWETAERTIGTVLAGARQRGVGLQGEAGMLAHLAEAAFGRGDFEVAIARAEEAVRVARRRGTVFFESLALLVLARVRLMGRGETAIGEVCSDLERAETLIRCEETASLQPVVHLVRALVARMRGDDGGAASELAAARRLFAAIGAHGHVARLAELLPVQAAS